MSEKSSKVICGLCNKGMTSRGIKRHLASCVNKNAKLIVDQTKQTPGVYHLRIESGYGGSTYWLHLAVELDTTLKNLDNFLRHIWLECCGHMSAFFAGKAYTSLELPMSRTIGQVIYPGDSLSYVYDFGSETRLIVTALSSYNGKLQGKNMIKLLARNPQPVIMCDDCGENQAEYICQECRMCDETGLLCSSCLGKHECDDEMFVRVMNSPRSGVCAYGTEYAL